jgi:predicted DsbA family dithiol-disulfide isomerase
LQEIKIYFDYVCPYCLIANANVNRFSAKYPKVGYVWKPWEILPEAPADGIRLDFDSVSTSLSRLAEEAGLWLRSPPIQPNSHIALLALFYAKENNKFQEYHNAIFDALWNSGENIGRMATVSHIMSRIGLNQAEFKQCLENDRDKYERYLAESEHDAEEDCIQLAPTYVSGERQIVGNVSARRIERFIQRVASLREKRATQQ